MKKYLNTYFAGMAAMSVVACSGDAEPVLHLLFLATNY